MKPSQSYHLKVSFSANVVVVKRMCYFKFKLVSISNISESKQMVNIKYIAVKI